MKTARYIPSLRFRWLTPIYDPVLKWIMREQDFKHRFIRQADIRPGMKVFDLGCGTGTLTLMIKRSHPEAEVTGLDGDPQVLEIARGKPGAANVQWDRGLATCLPYPDAAFDRVVTSLVIHHLPTDDKRRAFKEMHRVLRPQGELHVLDFGAPHSSSTRFMATVMRHLEETADNFDGRIPSLIAEAGFRSVQETENLVTLFGPLSMIQAVKGA